MATAAMVIIIIAIVVHIFLCCNCPFLLPSGCVNSRVFFCCWIVQCKLHPWLFGLIVPTLIALSWLSPFRRRWRHLRQIRDELSLWWSLFVFAPSVSHVSLGLTEHHVLGLFISPWFCFVWFCWSCDGFAAERDGQSLVLAGSGYVKLVREGYSASIIARWNTYAD